MKRFRVYENIAVFSITLLVSLFVTYIYSPVITSYAAVSPEVNVEIESSINLATSANDVNMDSEVGSFVHNSLTLTVVTNSQYGYTLAVEDADEDTSMVHENPNVSDTMSSDFAGAKTSDSMSDNTWGFSVDNGQNYYHIPEFGVPTIIARTDGYIPNGTASHAVDFGVKVGMTTAGTYQDTVKFTAYTNGFGGLPENGSGVNERGTKIDGSMQAFGCSNLASGETIVLKDIRDNNTYTVAKLADGNCWMTQNLRISAQTLTADDSDVSSTYTMGGSQEISLLGDKVKRYVDNINKNHPVPSSLEESLEISEVLYRMLLTLSKDNGGYYSTTVAYGGYVNSYESMAAGSNTVPSSICPKNWRIPTENEFKTLISKYSDRSALKNAPVNITYSGQVVLNTEVLDDSGLNYKYTFEKYNEGNMAHYITSTMKEYTINGQKSTLPTVYHIDDNKIQSEYDRGSDFHSVRCIAR